MLVMSRCDSSVADQLEQGRAFTEGQISAVLLDCTKALGYLAAVKVLHRDIKPANILANKSSTYGRTIYLLGDFGLSREDEDGDTTDKTDGAFIGTPKYRAPELFLSQPYNRQVDIWSLGTTIYRLVANEDFVGKWLKNEPSTVRGRRLKQLMEDEPRSHTIANRVSESNFLVKELCEPRDRVGCRLSMHFIGGLSQILHAMLQVNPVDRISVAELHAEAGMAPRDSLNWLAEQLQNPVHVVNPLSPKLRSSKVFHLTGTMADLRQAVTSAEESTSAVPPIILHPECTNYSDPKAAVPQSARSRNNPAFIVTCVCAEERDDGERRQGASSRDFASDFAELFTTSIVDPLARSESAFVMVDQNPMLDEEKNMSPEAQMLLQEVADIAQKFGELVTVNYDQIVKLAADLDSWKVWADGRIGGAEQQLDQMIHSTHTGEDDYEVVGDGASGLCEDYRRAIQEATILRRRVQALLDSTTVEREHIAEFMKSGLMQSDGDGPWNLRIDSRTATVKDGSEEAGRLQFTMATAAFVLASAHTILHELNSSTDGFVPVVRLCKDLQKRIEQMHKDLMMSKPSQSGVVDETPRGIQPGDDSLYQNTIDQLIVEKENLETRLAAAANKIEELERSKLASSSSSPQSDIVAALEGRISDLTKRLHFSSSNPQSDIVAALEGRISDLRRAKQTAEAQSDNLANQVSELQSQMNSMTKALALTSTKDVIQDANDASGNLQMQVEEERAARRAAEEKIEALKHQIETDRLAEQTRARQHHTQAIEKLQREAKEERTARAAAEGKTEELKLQIKTDRLAEQRRAEQHRCDIDAVRNNLATEQAARQEAQRARAILEDQLRTAVETHSVAAAADAEERRAQSSTHAAEREAMQLRIAELEGALNDAAEKIAELERLGRQKDSAAVAVTESSAAVGELCLIQWDATIGRWCVVNHDDGVMVEEIAARALQLDAAKVHCVTVIHRDGNTAIVNPTTNFE